MGKSYTAGKKQQYLAAKDKFPRAGCHILMAFMLGHIAVAPLPISNHFPASKFFSYGVVYLEPEGNTNRLT